MRKRQRYSVGEEIRRRGETVRKRQRYRVRYKEKRRDSGEETEIQIERSEEEER